MNRILQIRAALLVIGIVIWGYGYAIENDTVRLIAIAIVAVALILRFFQKRQRNVDQPHD